MFYSGLADQSSTIDNNHVEAMASYAIRIREQLNYVNEHSFNNFKIRIGIKIKLKFEGGFIIKKQNRSKIHTYTTI